MMSAGEEAFLLAGTMVVLTLCLIAYRWRFHFLHMSVCAIVLGSIGMLLGARVDFGQFGLAIIADWCSVQQPARFLIMILGMTAGTWGGWWLAEWALNQRTRRAAHAAARHAPTLRN
jgi:hypothetical protein